MDRAFIDAHHVMERYLADQLTPQERKEFVAYLEAHPEVVQELDATAGFKAGLIALEQEGELQRLRPVRRVRPVHYLALAATIAALAIGVSLWMTRVPSSSALSASQTSRLSFAGSYAVLRTRDTIDATIPLPVERAALELVVEVSRAASGYSASLAGVDGQSREVVGSVTALRSTDDGHVTVYLDSLHVPAGRYQLTLEPEAAGPPERFNLLFEQPPAR